MEQQLAEKEDKIAQRQDSLPGTAPTRASKRMLYLLSRYPAISHTFFLTEVRALRKIGFDIEVASINPSDRAPSQLSAEESEEAHQTFYIKSVGISGVLRAAALKIFSDPAGFLHGLGSAIQLGGWEPRSALYALFYFAEALVTGHHMRQRGLKHLHIHFSGPVCTVGLLVSKTWNIPYSITVHGPEEFYDVSTLHLGEKIESASFVFCISEFCRSQLMLLVRPEQWSKLHVLRLGIDPEVFVPATQRFADTSVPVILSVGRLVPAKGQMILLEACHQLHQKGRDFQLILVGNGPDRTSLEQYARLHNLPVTFAGARTHAEIREQLRTADLFVLASFAEGVPVALMEAMAMEVPCVSTFIAGIPELIRNGIDGSLVSPSSVDQLAEALDRLLLDSDLRLELGRAGRLRVLDRYNLSKNIPLLGEAFQQCL